MSSVPNPTPVPVRAASAVSATAVDAANTRHPRRSIAVETVALGAALFFAICSNGAFWHAVSATGTLQGPHGWMMAASLFVALVGLTTALLCAVLYRPIAKPTLALVLVVTAMASFYMSRYTVYLDADMIRNVLHTDAKESHELLTPGMVAWVLGFGVLPAVLLWPLQLKRRTLGRAFWLRLAWIGGALAISFAAMLLSFQGISALMRNHKEVRHLVTPLNYVMASARVLAHDNRPKGPKAVVGASAQVVGRAANARPRLLVLVVGETTRAQNWGLNGYARQTTPQLARIGPINFAHATACGSSTEVSVPCMFSPFGRAHYDKDRIEGSQSLVDVLAHAGIPTLWRDNQTGCKGVCDSATFESFEHGTDPVHCDAEGCLDPAMLDHLDAAIARHPGDQVIVMHQLGNHGPSYYKRYAPKFERFTPVCKSPELGQCDRQGIVNAYDNAVLQTDDFLARTIAELRKVPDRDTALIYMSDHGESLGENGLYLHGVPYAIAPDTQLRVPMVMWISPGFAGSRGIDLGCLRNEAGGQVSHDNLFHSVLGLMQVHAPEYDAQLDLFHACSA